MRQAPVVWPSINQKGQRVPPSVLRGLDMKRIFLVAVAAVAISAPAAGRAGTPYVGIEGGLLDGRDNDIDERVDFTTSQSPGTPLAPTGPSDAEFDDVFNLGYEAGHDIGLIGGYDFGRFRVELELAHKRAGFDEIDADETFDALRAALDSGLNRPSAAPDPGAPGLPALADGDFDVDGNISVRSAMVNGLVDLGLGDKLTLYGGGGYGRSWAKAMGDTDSAWAWQYILGIRYAISPRVELGFKHRYFNSGIVSLQGRGRDFAGNPDRLTIDGTAVDRTTSARLMPELEGEFRTRSFLLSLIYRWDKR